MKRWYYIFERIWQCLKIFLLLISGLIILFVTIEFFKPNDRKLINKFSCNNILRSMGVAFKNYAIDNEGYFPPYDGAAGLELLRINDYLSDPMASVCPATKTIPAKSRMPLTEETVSYVYRANFKSIGFFLLIILLFACQRHFDTSDAVFS